MSLLTLDLFARAADPEAARYRVLAGLQEARRRFAQNCVYPTLGRLVDLHRGLRDILDGAGRVEQRPTGRAVDVDWEAGRLVHEGGPEAPVGLELARWAMPRLVGAIEEGQALYDFAAEHAAFTPVGLVPRYHAEGFLLLDAEAGPRALRYQVSALTGADGQYRSLRTASVPVALDPLAPPQVWKRTLAEAAPDLPAPATFCLRADLDLPVEETLLPIGKRKLLAFVQSWGAA
ncbi:MAG: hypothetical protein AAF845_13125 [Bacteroidota bacterium]